MPQPNNNDTSSQVRTLLTQASELPAGERETFLDQACRGDDAVRAEVQALLSMLEHADDFLNRFPADQAPSDASSTGLLDRGP